MQEPSTTTERSSKLQEPAVEAAVADALPAIMNAIATGRARQAAADAELEHWYFCGDGSVMRSD